MQKILVVDDDRDMRLVLTKYLSKFNYQVLEAGSGKSALEMLETSTPDLVLCDFKLGDMDGTTLLIKIKEKYNHVPVIFITGYGDIKIAVEVMRSGAFDYVTKPLFPEEILLTIRKALAQKEKGDQPLLNLRFRTPHKRRQSHRGNMSPVSTFSGTVPCFGFCSNRLNG